jgi:hypothetical protein
MLPAESFACAVKLAVPAMGMAPATTPELERLSPTAERLLAPDLTYQVYGVPVPPVAASVCE